MNSIGVMRNLCSLMVFLSLPSTRAEVVISQSELFSVDTRYGQGIASLESGGFTLDTRFSAEVVLADAGFFTVDTRAPLLRDAFFIPPTAQQANALVGFRIVAEKGKSYYIEFKNDLLEPVWKLFGVILGNGEPQAVIREVDSCLPSLFCRISDAASTERFLAFPLGKSLQKTPYTASISAVLDHHMTTGGSRADDVVVAYTGERGEATFGRSLWHEDEGFGDLYGLQQDVNRTPFQVCGQYVDADEERVFLFYDGHTGYDYPAPNGTEVFASADGTAYQDTSSGGAFDVRIDHPNGYSTYYLHLQSNEIGLTPKTVCREALIGRVGLGHLHLTVKKGMQRVDPYGWRGAQGQDPLKVDGNDNKCLWLECQGCP